MQMAAVFVALLRGGGHGGQACCTGGGSKGGRLNRSLCSSHLFRLPDSRPLLRTKGARPEGHPDLRTSSALGSNAQPQEAVRIQPSTATVCGTMCSHCWLKQEQ